MDLQPSLFIGSSSEGYAVAERLRDLLIDITVPVMWKDVFDYNTSNFDNLISKIALYDYAILVATGDDVVISRKRKTAGARDNVLFEFGLFAGGLGRSRAFYVVEENTNIPSDLSGLSLPFLPKRDAADFDEKLQECAKRIKNHIRQKENTFDLGFLPSTTLAYGYFVNFVERTVERLLEDRHSGKIFHLEDGNHFSIKDIKFTVLIPDDLSGDMFKKVKAKRLKDGWQKLKVEPKDVRDYDFSINVSKVGDGLLHLVDIPFTLNALSKSIDFYAKVEHLGKDEKEALLEKRAIRNFKLALDYLIQQSSLTRGLVNTEVVDI
jgi:hypothetical protein